MALVTTVRGPASNSYVTLEEAGDRIASMDYDSSYWDSLSVSAREECLILAARAVDRLPLRGKRVNRYIPEGEWYALEGWDRTDEQLAQSLAFPRTIQADGTIIPEEVKEAQIDIAATVIAPNYPPTSDTVGSAQKKDISSVTLGSLSVRFRDVASRSSFSFRPEDIVLLSSSVIALKLQPYLAAIRGMRVDALDDDIQERVDDYISVSSSSSSLSSSSSSSAVP